MLLNHPASILVTTLPQQIRQFYASLQEDVEINGIAIAETADHRGIYCIDFPSGTYDRWEWSYNGTTEGRTWFAWKLVEEQVQAAA